MNIYICTSTKNLAAYFRLRDELTACGHRVLDWTRLLPERGPFFNSEKDKDPGGHIFAFCGAACAGVDLVVYLGPSGQDAGVELGIAHTAGVRIWGVVGRGEAPGLMVRGCVSRWFRDLDALVLELTRRRGW